MCTWSLEEMTRTSLEEMMHVHMDFREDNVHEFEGHDVHVNLANQAS